MFDPSSCSPLKCHFENDLGDGPHTSRAAKKMLVGTKGFGPSDSHPTISGQTSNFSPSTSASATTLSVRREGNAKLKCYKRQTNGLSLIKTFIARFIFVTSSEQLKRHRGAVW